MAQRKTAQAIEPISNDQRFAAADAILRTLLGGAAQLAAELDALNIERHLGLQKTTEDPQGRTRGNKLRLTSRNMLLRDRLEKHRATAPVPKEAETETGELPVTVSAALQIIRGSRPPSRVDRQKLIEQLQNDCDVIHTAVVEQQAVVDGLRNELSADMASRLVSTHRELMLSQFRAAQAFAAATDAEAEFRRLVISAGYTWRADVLCGPQLRAALVLGSETTFDSDISRARRTLEELKIL